MDWFNKCTKWIDQNRWLFVSLLAFVLIVSVGFAATGCASKTVFRGQQVDRTQLDALVQTEEAKLKAEQANIQNSVTAWNEKVEILNATTNAALDDLDAKDLQRQKIIEAINTTVTGAAAGTLTPAAVIPTGIGLLGIFLGLGMGGDNRRKDAVIAKLKKAPPAP